MNREFSLIELAIVFVIIGSLVFVAIPKIKDARIKLKAQTILEYKGYTPTDASKMVYVAARKEKIDRGYFTLSHMKPKEIAEKAIELANNNTYPLPSNDSLTLTSEEVRVLKELVKKETQKNSWLPTY